LDKVTFRYRPEASPVLNSISLDIRPGEIIGIVGRSGSGKSTLTKLVQRLYSPEGGRLLVDGIDISLIDAAQLRRQVGVVLQENCSSTAPSEKTSPLQIRRRLSRQ
jgi:ATP-binding cassette, subfamily B, bacterial HlyB/CyaB